MLRTLDGSACAYLSNRYRRIDNIDIASVTLSDSRWAARYPLKAAKLLKAARSIKA